MRLVHNANKLSGNVAGYVASEVACGAVNETVAIVTQPLEYYCSQNVSHTLKSNEYSIPKPFCILLSLVARARVGLHLRIVLANRLVRGWDLRISGDLVFLSVSIHPSSVLVYDHTISTGTRTRTR